MKYFLLVASVLFLNSCSNTNKDSIVSTSPNPAASKCIEDGFELHPIKQNDIVISSMCLNKKSGKKCKSWAYYRGECSLK